MTPAVEVRDLVRRFGSFEAVRGISFDIPAGAVLGDIVGPAARQTIVWGRELSQRSGKPVVFVVAAPPSVIFIAPSSM